MIRQADALVRTGFKPDVVILGADGAIGHHIVKAFAGKGMQVAAVSQAPATRNAGANVHFLQGDACDSDALARLIGDAPFLVNAARPKITEDWADCERKVQEAIGAVSSACKRAGVKRLVHISSIAALYLGDKGDVVTGRAPVDPYGWQRSNYSRARGVEEIALLTQFEEAALPVSILRPGIMVGEGATPYHAGVGLFSEVHRCIGRDDGRHPLPFVLGEDVASAVVAATERDGVLGHCYNLAGDVRLSAREYVEALGKALGRPLVFQPRSPTMTYCSEMAKWGIKRVGGHDAAHPSKRDLHSRTMVATLDCADAKAALDWAPVADRETFIARGILVHTDNRHAGDGS